MSIGQNGPLASSLAYRLRELTTAGSVLHLGSHPDDEDSGMLAYLTRGLGVRSVYWSATRGEGSLNRRGPETGPALGLVRTWESLSARELDGSEVLYGPFYDYGFSKHGDDALHRWGHDRLLGEIVRAIRIVQPLIVISRWTGGPTDGHGHHQAVGMKVAEAFTAAGDADRFPDLGLPPWQPKKLYRSLRGDWQPGMEADAGGRDHALEDAGCLGINAGAIDPIAGVSFRELAYQAFNRHRSQGVGFVPEPGDFYYYYQLERSLTAGGTTDVGLFDGLDPTVIGLASELSGEGTEEIRKALSEVQICAEQACEVFRPDRPHAAGPSTARAAELLHIVLRQLPLASDTTVTRARLVERARAFEEATAACFAVRVECLLDRAHASRGRTLKVRTRVWNGGASAVRILDSALVVPPGWTVRDTDADTDRSPKATMPFEAHHDVDVPSGADITPPYWLREPREPYAYVWPQDATGEAHNQAVIQARVRVRIDDHELTLASPGTFRSSFAGGFRELGLSIVPELSVRPQQRLLVYPKPDEDVNCEVLATVVAAEEHAGSDVLSLRLPEGWRAQPLNHKITLLDSSDVQTVTTTVTIPAGTSAESYALTYELGVDHVTPALDVDAIRLPSDGASDEVNADNCAAEAFHIRTADVTVRVVEAEFVRTLRYGYVEGMDERILKTLERFNLDLSFLSDDDLSFSRLADYDAIVVGPNAFGARQALARVAERLRHYVSEGGTLIIQHQGYGFDTSRLAPYPIRFDQPHVRVTDPDAAITILDAAHPIATYPNALAPDDFTGWVHDRGLFFCSEWDPRYSPVLSCADRGEPPRAGGLLVAAYGSGSFVYCGYSLFRQIPAGVPGAIRLFANLLGLAEARVRDRRDRLRTVHLFQSFSDDELYQAARIVSERRIEPAELLATEGEAGDELYVLVSGDIAVLKAGADGDRLLRMVGPGETLGELAVLSHLPRTASLRAGESGARVLVLPGEALYRWLREHPDLALRLLEQLSRMVATINQEA